MAEEYGEPEKYDPKFNGPIKNRGCTDIICCVLFMVFILGYIVVGVLAWVYGDPRQVIYPRNSTGMYCGVGENQNKPYLLYYNLLKCITGTSILASAMNGLQCPTTQVCVKECPQDFRGTSFWASPKDAFIQEYCQPSINLTTTELSVYDIVAKELCPAFLIKSDPLFNRCFPSANFSIPPNFSIMYEGKNLTGNESKDSILNATNQIFDSFNFQNLGKKIFQDFAKSWSWILIALAIAMLTSFLFLILLRFIAGILVWLLIIGVIGVIGYGIYHCYMEYDTFKKTGATINNVGFTTNLSAYFNVQETWLAFFIILLVVEVILLLLLLFLRKRILIAIALIKEASKAIAHIMSSLFYPLVTFVLLVVCVAYWSMTALYLATSGTPIYVISAPNSSIAGCTNITGNQTCDPMAFNASSSGCSEARCIFYKYNTEGIFQQNLFNLQIYNVIGFLWCINFVIALGQCVLAGTFASYYWAFHKPKDIPYFPVSAAFMRTLRYHTGSLAFGALILTIVQLIRIILEYLDHRLKGSQNACTRFLLCCLKCCFWCLEKFIKFLNRNAYIMIAVYGKNFCVSAKNAFKLLMRNIVRVVVLDKVTDLLIFFGKLIVVGGVGVLAFFFFSGRLPIPNDAFKSPTLNYYWIPILTVVLGSYMIAQGFFSVYTMCVDTLFLCFLEDLERHDGSPEKPYYMSKSLMSILNKKNQPRKGSGKKKK
ncbi:choline transporter-like protein 4 isoform X1 [Dendrobates tinctorius]|uniref:choline transporter-like protein 4 isoform X1 n=2 Tax=Dendrobates tinctorius TaxID=92724 RepID=UPI003CC9AC1C